MTKALLLVVSCLAAEVAQRPAVLQGRVVRAGAGVGVAHARIVAARVGGSADDYLTGVTDQAGRFGFQNVAPGTYRVHATRAGYLPAEYGRRAAGTSGTSIVLGEGQASPDILISMTPTGAIAGRVLDRGRPLRNALVRALKTTYFNGQRSLNPVEWAQTDDRGEYRLFGLAPGSYVVSAIPRQRPRIEGETLVVPLVPSNANNNQREIRSPLALGTLEPSAFEGGVYPSVYHPGTTDPAAALPVGVRGGDTAFGIDFTIVASPVFHVRGRAILASAGVSTPGVRVGVRQVEVSTVLPIPGVEAKAGSFDIAGVPPGRYYVSAQTTGQQVPLTRAAIEVEVVDRDLDVVLTMQPGVQVVGRLSIEGRTVSPTAPPILVQLQGGPFFGSSAVRVRPDGVFTMDNVPPGEYRFRVAQGAWAPWVKAAHFGGEDVLTAPIRLDGDLKGRQLEIVLGSNPAALDAYVVDGNQRPVSGVLVIAVPDASRRNQSSAYRTATTDADGRARIEGLTPGAYMLFASEGIEAGAWQDPAVLQREESRGTAVRAREGTTQSVTLRITS